MIVQKIGFEFFAETTTVLAYPELKKVVFRKYMYCTSLARLWRLNHRTYSVQIYTKHVFLVIKWLQEIFLKNLENQPLFWSKDSKSQY